jgi:hypothetical protein
MKAIRAEEKEPSKYKYRITSAKSVIESEKKF